MAGNEEKKIPCSHLIFFLILKFCRVGAHYRSSSTGTEQDFQVERIINHHRYKQPRGLAHDISLLKLRQPAQLNRHVGLACLPVSSTGASGQVPDDKICWVTGIDAVAA